MPPLQYRCDPLSRRWDSRRARRRRVRLLHRDRDPSSVCCWHARADQGSPQGRRQWHWLRSHRRRDPQPGIPHCWMVDSGSRSLRIGSRPNQFRCSDLCLFWGRGPGIGDVRQYSLRDISKGRSSMLRHSFRTPARSWRIICPRHSRFSAFPVDTSPMLCDNDKREGLPCSWRRENLPSLVMNEMNSLTHSCMHSFASLAILALSGSAVFMIRATGAKFRMLASDAARA